MKKTENFKKVTVKLDIWNVVCNCMDKKTTNKTQNISYISTH